MSKKVFLFQKKETKPETLAEFLYHNLFYDKKIQFTLNHIKKLTQNGFVKLEDRVCKNPDIPIKCKQTASIVVLVKEIRRYQKPVNVSIELKVDQILYEDKDIVCVNKPEGIPTHATLDPERDNLASALKRYYKKTSGKVPYLALHHRLDSDTSGVILFCKNKDINKDLADLFAQREIEKTYLAVVQNLKPLPDTWEIKNHLARTQKKDELQKMQSVKSGGDYAHTTFSVVGESEDIALLEAQPHTGRTHQIRIHLFEYGVPILGDKTYHNDSSHKFKRMYLHAWKLRFHHPILKKEIEIHAPAPDAFQELFDFKID